MHANQLTVTPQTVRELVAAQFPQWQALEIRAVASTGTVNAIFRIGERLAARFPLEPREIEEARSWLAGEAAAASRLAGHTRFATPEPVALGEPGAGYPLPWSVQTWLPGTVATEADPSHSTAFAEDLAEFVTEVRTIDTEGRTFTGTGRGGDLRAHEPWIQTCFDRSEHLLDVPSLKRLWADLRTLPRGNNKDVMSHTDLIPGNVLVKEDRLTGILDVGGLAPADPALDLVGAWHLLEDKPRQTFRNAMGGDDLEWQRGKAWAFIQAMGAVWYYVDSNPTMSHMGRTTLARITRNSKES